MLATCVCMELARLLFTIWSAGQSDRIARGPQSGAEAIPTGITKHVTHLTQAKASRKHESRQSLMLQEAHQGSDYEAHEGHL